MKKTIVSIIGISMLFGAGVGAYANANLQEIKAYLNNDIKVKVNGKVATLLDQQGNVVTPITYDGSTYLPARAIANSLSVAVDYDAATNSVLFGEKVEGTPVNAVQSFALSIKDPTLTKYKNKDYVEVFNITSDNGGSNFTFEPNKKFQKLYLQVAAVDTEIKLIIQDAAGKQIQHDNVKVEDGLKTIEVNVAEEKEVTIFYEFVNPGKNAGMFVPLTTSYYK
ncbi:hypothetical protein BC351_36615 [Paenibacillus ferrarius]|uniref:Copper amine oxidase-like N-terminal domain-containing protein n=1 Tax=Paenibacillus ferrarius TaxID=1469647 RepID=A0A1V4HCG3_9BACL|nr:stalk domain-containing protein [Paenibacillus ferrarius]OPH50020.1 hypothetical protein BC351_36615 [Paenibacillus ferrarius]